MDVLSIFFIVYMVISSCYMVWLRLYCKDLNKKINLLSKSSTESINYNSETISKIIEKMFGISQNVIESRSIIEKHISDNNRAVKSIENDIQHIYNKK